jgi:ADP-heptose:LPS heptosyltransferase
MSPLIPESLRVNPDRPYAYKSSFKTAFVRALDAIGGLFFPPSRQAIDWKSLKKIAVLRLDHLGDVMMALPVIKELEQALPNAQVDFFIGPWAKDIVEIAGLRATPKVFSASWFEREGVRRGTWNSIKALEELLGEGEYDAVIELRGMGQHILSMYKARIKHRVGMARMGLAFLLTHRLVYQPGLHEISRNLESLKQAGIDLSTPNEFPQLYPRKEDEQSQTEVRQKMGITRPVIAVHAICSAPAKRWPVSRWQQLMDQLPEEMDVVMIGTEGEKPGIEEIQKACRRKIFSAAGLLNLPALAAFLKECKLFIGVDSGPAHIAAAVGTPVVSVYSGINAADRWGPQGQQVTIIQKKPPCSPCELVTCPFDNECMRQIEVQEVLMGIQLLLKG